MSLYKMIKQKDFDEAITILQGQGIGAYEAMEPFEQEAVRMESIKSGKFNLLEMLLELGAFELDLMEYERWFGSIVFELFTFLKCDKNANQDAFDEAVRFVNSVIQRIENSDEIVEGQTLLEFAMAKNMPLEVLSHMVKCGCPIDQLDAHENTLLFKAPALPVAQWLIKEGLDVNHRNRASQTPLMVAIKHRNIPLATLLLENGAHCTQEGTKHHSLFYFALIDQGSPEFFELLCRYGSFDPNEYSSEKSTLLFDYVDRMYGFGQMEKRVVETLLLLGADVRMPNTNRYKKTMSVLDVVCEKEFDLFDFFLDFIQEDINYTDANGDTLLHKLCALEMNHDRQKVKELYKKVKRVIALGADTKAKNNQDKTPLDIAAQDNLKDKVVALLLH